MDVLTIIIFVLILVIIVRTCANYWLNSIYDVYDDDSVSQQNDDENFNGALQSLYSNDGIQDSYLTVNDDDKLEYDGYRYWRGVPWDLPTRNLDRIVYYPYLYEYHIDRYGRSYPYW